MIRIQNIYYMLSYAFQSLKQQGYMNCMAEEFETTAELFSEILAKGIEMQIKRGLDRVYCPVEEELGALRGKIDLCETIRTQAFLKHKLICCYDEFSVNSYLNQILKTTMEILIRSDISKYRKVRLRNLMRYFIGVSVRNPNKICWNFRLNGSNQTYRMLLGICYLTIQGLLQSKGGSQFRLGRYLDDQRMCRLYEKFLLEYFRKEFPQLKAAALQIPWKLEEENFDQLPIMQTDCVLCFEEKILILDAKYYTYTMQYRKEYNSRTIHSKNLYQIFTYVKNAAAQTKKTVAGMILYAKTEEDITPDAEFKMSGNSIHVKTLDLGKPFEQIAAQLNEMIYSYFGVFHS